MSNGFRLIIFFIFDLVLVALANVGILLLSKKITTLNYQKRYINKKIIILGILIPIAAYWFINILSFFGQLYDKRQGLNEEYLLQNILCERVGILFVLLAFFVVKSYFRHRQDNNLTINFEHIFPYKEKKDENSGLVKYYIELKYKNIGKQLIIVSYIIVGMVSLIETVFIFNNIDWAKNHIVFFLNYGHYISFALIYLFIYEMGVFLDGEVEPAVISKQEIKVKKDLFNEMLLEYRNVFKDNLLFSLQKNDKIHDDVTPNDDYIYSKIFTPIVEGENIIIETESLYTLNDIIPSLLNLIFATNRKIMFITENDAESIATYGWLKKCNIITENSKLVVEVYTENDTEKTIITLNDSNVDICIGTVDLLLKNKQTTRKADTIFSVNIDNVIVKSPVRLNILTRILAESKDKKVQYILFTNEVNGLQQSIEGAFYSENFSYQVVRQKYIKNFYAMFYAKEKGLLQNKVLPAMASESIGYELPLLITPLKYGFNNIYAFSEKEPYEDELVSLHKASPNLKIYYNNKAMDIEEKVTFLANEHFAENKDNMIIAYDDIENNLILILKNYIKYASSRILVNIVSDKYILRDYMIDNIDFFMQNYDYLGKIVPYHKDGKKISLFKLINELCLENFEEEYLIGELNKLTDIKIEFTDESTFNAENYVANTLRSLVNEVFGVDVKMDSYLYRELEFENAKQKKYVYRLSENVRSELPRNLFTLINFVTSDQKLKRLDRIPLYEIYQNYAIGQYIVFNGKSYLISSIDDREGIVNLIYNDRINNMTYMHKKDVTINILAEEKSENVYDCSDLQYEKISLLVDAKVVYSGYYKFSKGLNFKQGLYEYQKNDFGPVPENNYKAHKAFLIKFTTDKIKAMSDVDRLKIAETIAFLFNEVFKTIYCNANQYIILRAVTNKRFLIDNEVNDLYSPIVIDNFENAIGLIAMEDTELEKGVLDSFTLKLDTTIIPLITDYLEWLLDEDIDENKSKIIERLNNDEEINKIKNVEDIYIQSFNDERMCYFSSDKFDFLKLGKDDVKEFFDLENARSILHDVTISSGKSITNVRRGFVQKRLFVDNLNKKVDENGEDQDKAKDEKQEETKEETREETQEEAKEETQEETQEETEEKSSGEDS